MEKITETKREGQRSWGELVADLDSGAKRVLDKQVLLALARTRSAPKAQGDA